MRFVLECFGMTNIVFMGTPAFAVPTLRALAQHCRVVGVVTQPDRPAGRGRQTAASPVKELAMQLQLPIIQPPRLHEPEPMSQLTAWRPDLIVVAAFGQILRPDLLDLPPCGCVNVHASLLPRHRGAAPIAAAILAGDAETGVTIMRIDPGLDTGPRLTAHSEPIRPDDTSATLATRLADLGAALLMETLPGFLAGTVPAQPQDDALATFAPQLKKEDGHLDFHGPAVELERRVRAVTPWPGAFTLWQDQPFKVLRAALAREAAGEPGAVIDSELGPVVVCRPGGLLLLEVQAAGKKPVPATAFARGARNFMGATLK
jgi:methionyl-tRNA formyltransferase